MRVKRLFRSPLLFPPKPPEADGTWANNPSRPASFLRQLRPSTAPLPAFFAAKRGFFAPNTRRTRPRRAPERPVLPRRRPVFARRAPEKDPAVPVFARDPDTFADPWNPGSPHVCGFFARPRPLLPPPTAVFPPIRPKKAPPPPKNHPPSQPTSPLPPPAARRSAHPPRQGIALGQGNPDCRGRLFRFAVEKCATPRGGSDPCA